MLITKFNKMIRNRIVWWIIGGIVIITFVGWFSPRGGCEKLPDTGHAGALNGVPVTDAELRQARFNTYLSLCLMVGRIIPMSEEVDAELRDQAWKRIAALREAQAMGITASDDEVLDMIKRDPQFNVSGGFSKERYNQFVRSVLGALNTSVTQFEHQLAENIILQKLQGLTASAAWVSPADMNRIVSRYADGFALQYVTLPTNAHTGEITVSESELQAFFDAHTNRFIIPERVGVQYVQYAVSNYLAKAVTDATAVEEYYDTHSEEFTTTDTNEVKTVAPLETVRGAISNKLVHLAALELARNTASDFVIALAPGRDGIGANFATLAAATGLTVHATGLFDAQDGPAGLKVSPAFIEAAFRLRPTPDECFSDAVVESNAVYVLNLLTNTEARLPELAEVRDTVLPLAKEKARQDKLSKKAAELRERLAADLKSGQTFKAAAQAASMNVATTEVFTVYTAPEVLNAAETLEEITSKDTGELTDVLTTTNGLVIAYIAERKAASADESAAVKAQIGMNITRRRARTLFGEWQESLIRKGKTEATAASRTSGSTEPPIVD